jgi:rhamnose utilization protein RhaD (predicted bifunctional aldolase and dehydrogenase)
MLHKFKKLVDISQKIGNRPEYAQGGGGNISVKLSRNEMAIKASGFRLSDLNIDNGLVLVDHAKIKDFHSHIGNHEDIAGLTARYDMLLTDCTIKQNSNQTLRPSMEAGFHSFGGKYVLHAHSVYANILNCSKEGQDIIARMFKDAIFIPYAAPGISLTVGIQKYINDGSYPPIIFLENHGIIVSGKTAEEVYNIHEKVNALIRERFGIKKPYPAVSICRHNEKKFISTSPYIKESLKNNSKIIKGFHKTILFPDQVVYGESVGFEKKSKIAIDLEVGSIIYSTSYNEALAFEETLISWLFIIEHIERLGMILKTISEKGANFIVNMDSEKYRKGLLKHEDNTPSN